MEKETLYRFLRCETSPEEEAAIAEWLSESPEHQRELNDLQLVFNAMHLHAPETDARPLRPRISLFRLKTIVRCAGAAAAALLLFVGTEYWNRSRIYTEISERRTTLTVPAGQRVNLTLEDGSSVWLNAGTSISYPAAFLGEERRVAIDGEAMFDVAHDADKPFIVETYACDVRVLGTKFNVEATREENRFSTILMQGSVRISNRTTGEELLLRPNECAHLIDNRLQRGVMDDPDELLWPEGILSIKGVSFADLMKKFEQTYGVDIDIRCSEIPQVRYNRGKIRISDGIDHALHILQMSADFTYEKDTDDNRIIIR